MFQLMLQQPGPICQNERNRGQNLGFYARLVTNLVARAVSEPR